MELAQDEGRREGERWQDQLEDAKQETKAIVQVSVRQEPCLACLAGWKQWSGRLLECQLLQHMPVCSSGIEVTSSGTLRVPHLVLSGAGAVRRP